MRGPTDPQAPGIGVAEYGAALPGRRSERLPGLEPGLDQSLNFPGEVTRTDRTAAEVAASRYRDNGMESEALDARCRAERQPRVHHRQGRDERDPVRGHHARDVLVEREAMLQGVDGAF